MSADLQSIVRAHGERIRDRDIFFLPHIPAKKLARAVQSYARGAGAEEALALVDATLFGSAKNGLLLTRKMLYAKNRLQSATQMDLQAVRSVALLEGAARKLWADGQFVEARASDLYVNGRLFLRLVRPKKVETMRGLAELIREAARSARPQPPAWPVSELNPEEKKLVQATMRWQCLACPSQRLRPLILLARNDSASFVYNHDAIFACDDCHSGYADKRRHDSFDWEEVWDQDEHHPLDADSIAQLRQCLVDCPHPLSEGCACKVHESLRAGWAALPAQIWSQSGVDFPPALLRMADSDQERWIVPRVCVELIDGAPRLLPREGEWLLCYEDGNPKAQGHFKTGRMHGKWTYWYASGVKKAEGKYASDRRAGKWTQWNEKGEVIPDAT